MPHSSKDRRALSHWVPATHKLRSCAATILEQVARGESPALSKKDLDEAYRAGGVVLRARNQGALASMDIARKWGQTPRSVAALVALYTLAMRRSSFAYTDDERTAYEVLRATIVIELFDFTSAGGYPLGLALLRAGTLQCYSQLMAEYAKILQEATAPTVATAPVAGQQEQRPIDVGAQDKKAAGPLARVDKLLCQAVDTIKTVIECFLTSPDCRNTSSISGGSSGGRSNSGISGSTCNGSGGDGGGSCGGGSASSGGGSIGGGGGSGRCGAGIGGGGNDGSGGDGGSSGVDSTTCCPAAGSPRREPLAVPPAQAARAELTSLLRSSRVLEHWAHLHLVRDAATRAQGLTDLAAEAHYTLAGQLLDVHYVIVQLNLDWSPFLEGPCCAFLATQRMVDLCVKLDRNTGCWGSPMQYGLRSVHMEAFEGDVYEHAAADAVRWDTCRRDAMRQDLRFEGDVLAAWVRMLQPGWEGPSGAGSGGDAGPSEGPRERGQQKQQVPEQPETRERVHTGVPRPHAGMLPPYNRDFTFSLCCRLAAGVLHMYGGTVQYPEHVLALPKAMSSVVLFRALACARLALRRELQAAGRVGSKAARRLRKWWAAYVRAASHLEALTAARHGVIGGGGAGGSGWGAGGVVGVAVSPGDGPCADVAAALAAGLLPCMTQALGRVGAGSVGGSVWVPPDAFAGIAHTRGAGTGPAAGPLTLGFWQQLLLFGEQDQVNGFLAALGRCVEEAVEQLCVVASPRGRRKGGCGEAEWRVAVAGELLGFAAQRLNDMLRCAQAVATVASTQGQAGVGRENVGRAAGRGGSSEEGMRVWEEGAHEGIIRRAAKVLLPSAVSAVRTCVELMGAGRGSTSSSSSSSSSSSGNRLGPLLPALAACGEGVTRYLALLCSRVGGVAAAAEAAATVGANAPASHWTAQLVMEQLPLMGVLGDAVALWQMGADGGWDREPLRCGLAGALPLAAAVFPAQFRATVGKEVGKGAVRKLQGMGSLGCISMVGVQQVLGAGPGAGTGSGAGAGELLGVVRRVAAGWNPTPVEVCEVEAGLELAWC